MFSRGQVVIVLKLFNLKEDGAATIVREVTTGRDKGKYIVDIANVGNMVIDAERLVDAEAYWKEVKRGRDSLTKIETSDS